MTTNKTSRWLNLVAFLLQYRFPVTREKIFAQVTGYEDGESGRRKFERDKEELRALGVDIEAVPLPDAAGDEPATGYRLRPRSAYLPYLELLDEPATDKPYHGLDRLVLSRAELEILDRATRSLMDHKDTPFAAAAASARRKLAFDLPFTNEAIETILALPVPEHARQALAVLQEAVIERVAVSCRYFTMSRRTEEDRQLEPWGLLFQWGRWYCVARARDREDPRVFRVDRMHNVKRLPGTAPHFTVPDEFDVRSFAGRTPWEFGAAPVTTCIVRFEFPESRWVLNRGVGRLVREDADRSAALAFDVRDDESFLRWLLSFGRRAGIEHPVSMRESLDTLRADVAAMYAESAP